MTDNHSCAPFIRDNIQSDIGRTVRYITARETHVHFVRSFTAIRFPTVLLVHKTRLQQSPFLSWFLSRGKAQLQTITLRSLLRTKQVTILVIDCNRVYIIGTKLSSLMVSSPSSDLYKRVRIRGYHRRRSIVRQHSTVFTVLPVNVVTTINVLRRHQQLLSPRLFLFAFDLEE